MRILTGRVALFGACLSIAGCGALLDTGFDWDKPGHSPSMTTLGFQGAQIRPGASKNVFVTSKMGLVGQQALAFIETAEPVDGSHRTFLQSAPVKDPTEPVYINWRGQFGAGGTMKVVLGLLGQPYVTMRFADGDLFLDDAKVGNFVPGDHHSVAVTLDPKARSYKVAFSGHGTYHQNAFEGSAPASKNDAGMQVIADFGIESVGQERLVYVLDDVRISHNASN